jgi:hypothetical protein
MKKASRLREARLYRKALGQKGSVIFTADHLAPDLHVFSFLELFLRIPVIFDEKSPTGVSWVTLSKSL